MRANVSPPPPSRLEIYSSFFDQRFALRFLDLLGEALRAATVLFSTAKSSSRFPSLIAATSHRGLAPRPAQVLPDLSRYLMGTRRPFSADPPPPHAWPDFATQPRELALQFSGLVVEFFPNVIAKRQKLFDRH
jgi:hypothetical protein